MSDDEPTLHEVLARGIDKGLRDVGADLTGCTPATLTGHIIRELLAAGLHPGPSRKRTPSATEPQWRIGIEVPMRLPGDERHDLFERVAALVHRWEPQARDGWDANVYGCPVADDAPDHFHPEPGTYGCGGCDKDKPGYCSNCPDLPAATPRPEGQR